MAGVCKCCIVIVGLLFWLWPLLMLRRERSKCRTLMLFILKEQQNILTKGRGAAVLQLLEMKQRMRRMLVRAGVNGYIKLPKRRRIKFE